MTRMHVWFTMDNEEVAYLNDDDHARLAPGFELVALAPIDGNHRWLVVRELDDDGDDGDDEDNKHEDDQDPRPTGPRWAGR